MVVGYWWNRIIFIQIMASKGFKVSESHPLRVISPSRKACPQRLHSRKLMKSQRRWRWWSFHVGGLLIQILKDHPKDAWSCGQTLWQETCQPTCPQNFLLDLYPRQLSGSPQHRTWEIKIPFDASMSVSFYQNGLVLPDFSMWVVPSRSWGQRCQQKYQKYNLHLGERIFHCFILKSEVLPGLKIC